MTGGPGASGPAVRGPGEAGGVGAGKNPGCETAGAGLLTALYALCHRVGISAGESVEIGRLGACLTPEVWRDTRRLLGEAHQEAAGRRRVVGFEALLLRWLGHRDEGAVAGAYGVGVAEALARGRGELGAIAHIVDGGGGSGAPGLRSAVAGAWASRGARLMDGLPGTGPGAVAALERALAAYEWPPRRRRLLLAAMVAASGACGDEARAGAARRSLEEEDRGVVASDPTSMYRIGATVLTVLWCIAHDDGLLGAERGLDPGIGRSPEVWARARSALDAGRPGEVPVPVRTFAAWSGAGGLDEGELRVCLEEAVRVHPDLPRIVELLWRRTDPHEDVSRKAAWYAVDAVFRRRLCLERGYTALPGERESVYFEVYQGARRPEALERLELARRLHLVLARCGDVEPMAVVSVLLDLAVEREALGEHEASRRHLAAAVEHVPGVEDPVWREYPEVGVATWHWRSGEVGEALRRLERLEGPKAVEARRLIEAKAPERERLREAERVRVRRGDVESACAVVAAHLRAGHDVAAERHARELCDESPDSPHAWASLAGVLHDLGRYRDAVEPARAARSAGYEEPGASAPLARIVRRLGAEGREEGRRLARRSLVVHAGGRGLEESGCAERERIEGGGGGDARSGRDST